MQKIMCTGRITQNLELRYSNENKPVLYIPVAVLNNSREAKPLYINFLVYGDIAKTHAQYLTKGSTIGIEGHVYQTEKDEDGKKKRYYNFYADKVEYLNIKRETTENFTENLQKSTEISTEPDPFRDFREKIVLTDDMLPF